MKSINEIKTELNSCGFLSLPDELSLLKDDGRTGVRKLVESYQKKYDKYIKEIERLESINVYENNVYVQGYHMIAGIDEVGRGPLAGPVVACALILVKDSIIAGVDDSKKLTEQKRARLFWDIQEKAIDFGIGRVEPQEIDEINIANATYKAMQMAVNNLKTPPDYILVDGYPIPYINTPQKAIIKGDSKSATIAAASIIAKVTRDEIMCRYAEEYPKYGFDSNKGYGTEKHIEAIQKYGLTPIHRRSFVRNTTFAHTFRL